MDEAELDQLGDLSIDDDNDIPVPKEKKEEEKASVPKGLDIAGDENEEVMLSTSINPTNPASSKLFTTLE